MTIYPVECPSYENLSASQRYQRALLDAKEKVDVIACRFLHDRSAYAKCTYDGFKILSGKQELRVYFLYTNLSDVSSQKDFIDLPIENAEDLETVYQYKEIKELFQSRCVIL